MKLIVLLSLFSISAFAGRYNSVMRFPANTRINETCLEKKVMDTAMDVVKTEISSSLKNSFTRFFIALKRDWGDNRVNYSKDGADWRISPYDSYYYQMVTGVSVGKNGEEVYEVAREDECSYLVSIDFELLYSRGFVTTPYMVYVKIQKDGKDNRWTVTPGSPQRAVYRFYPNNNPRG